MVFHYLDKNVGKDMLGERIFKSFEVSSMNILIFDDSQDMRKSGIFFPPGRLSCSRIDFRTKERSTAWNSGSATIKSMVCIRHRSCKEQGLLKKRGLP